MRKMFKRACRVACKMQGNVKKQNNNDASVGPGMMSVDPYQAQLSPPSSRGKVGREHERIRKE